VQVNNVSTLNFALTIGTVNETVTIVADAPSIQSETRISVPSLAEEIEDLPLSLAQPAKPSTSVESFVFLAPAQRVPALTIRSGIFESKLNGGQAFSTEVLLMREYCARRAWFDR